MASASPKPPPIAEGKPDQSTSQPSPSPRSPPSLSSQPNSLPPSHPISLRIRSILTANYDEDSTKRALQTLSQLYSTQDSSSTNSVSPANAKYHPQARQPRVDTERARKFLDHDIQQRLSMATLDFIQILKTVDDSLEELSTDVSEMAKTCREVQSDISKASRSSRYLLEHSRGLEKQMESSRLQEQLSNLFLQRFTLTDEEKESIHSNELRVGSQLFSAMDRLDTIRQDCRLLLQGDPDSGDVGGSGGGTKAGLEIMSSTSEDLETAYQKIFRWCSFEFRQPVKEGLEVSPQLKQAVRRLFKRQDLLRPALSTLANTRSSILMNSFINALTVGGPPPTYLPRPIELHAHDPIRYVGDMLAWVHQSLASEREFLTSLFGEKEGEGGRRIGQRRRGLEGSLDMTGSDPGASLLGPGELLVRELLNRNLEGCCRPLKVRVQQTVRSQEGSVTTYRLAHLVEFYRNTMEKTIGTRAALSKTLKEISEISFQAFFVTLERQAAGLLRFDEPPSHDLSPPHPLMGACGTLKDLLTEHQRSLADGEGQTTTAASTKEGSDQLVRLDDFDQILDRLVEPMVEMCKNLSELTVTKRARGKSLEAALWEKSIFSLNSLGYLLNVLQPYEFTSAKVAKIKEEIAEESKVLTSLHHENLLEGSGLKPIIQAIASKNADTPLSHDPSATPTEVQKALNQLNDFLCSSNLITSPRLSQLTSPSTRAEIHGGALSRLKADYGRIVEAVEDASNKYEWRQTLIRRSVEEVGILLGVDQDQVAA
ncbi:oligomeric complex COG6 [Violaceomyces palustris]|uniref:Oligomeric complex COG6 n=1 Tax=Violaceomyces palustris TaxID=1673888 RepID=A0ACD0P333_9BASI|nr:oligomeric complex COG6 [Violaceomyces palustris]